MYGCVTAQRKALNFKTARPTKSARSVLAAKFYIAVHTHAR
ncbi:hypothetical protein CAMGR0001_0997 [Campylobacter gracilis RM3268]|uniref:Uncharacterized protein n=1 Tax=Campylobacter gracilis RM3268 TaxID=553220 RepID=C8PGK2_9BACT|nr:hypothetical protein CAMGR0001_0997 [Campylobacter gracilis RM3268]